MHEPVLSKEAVEYLAVSPNKHFIDATLGSGGHTKAILSQNAPKGKVLAIDWDPEALERARLALTKSDLRRVSFVTDNFAHLQDIAKRERFHAGGVLLDLGMSSDQLEHSGRGFSFQRNEVLDMRYSMANPLSAAKILNYWSKQDIARVLKEYGQEQFASEIAEAIVRARSSRPLVKTQDLVLVIEGAVPRWYKKRKLHPATKTFQALRIAVNHELENLRAVLVQAFEVLHSGGRVVVITFHSLEDRIVKYAFRENPKVKVLTKKVVIPSFRELQRNPRARSAKLRAGERI